MVESWVEPATSATVNTIISMAGSAREAIITSRLEPMPPKLVPTSSPASARKKRAAAEQRDDGDEVGGPGEQEPGAEGRHQRRRDPGGGEDDVGRRPKQPGRVLRQHGVLAHQPDEIAVRLEQRRALPAQEPRLDLAHEAGEQRREQQHQEHLRALDGKIEDHDHMASTRSKPTKAAKTKLR